ncbi:GerAB/ArcD/ProY family transporter [Virgibacillus alimentarius]|uniref:GerAB/ArcD/ProY family transporter n=1 Tax=Virgibacillus alimentarius TaxID=698769 RepID=UPI000493A834|nr:endospore germination permease [Virgibacillus alimentarius]
MKRFKHADELISEREIMIAIPSFVIGVGVLTFSKDMAAVTIAADGWIPILIGGIIAIMITWIVAKLASSFPNQTFLSYASCIVTKPVALVLTFLFAVIASQLAVLQIREIADISKQYIFDRTPVEVIALTFLLVVVYAVAGSRVGLLRLNMMFFPIILVISLLVIVFSLNRFEWNHLFPMLETDFTGYMKGLRSAIFSYVGFGILWFYTVLVKKPKKVPKKAVIGMCIPVGLYLFIYVSIIGVFGNAVTSNLLFPTIELAKGVEIPGEIFERFESVFFTIWIMAIFNTTAMALDICVFALNSIFKNVQKYKILFVLSPLVYANAMYPQDLIEVYTYGTIVGYITFGYTVFVALLLLVVGKLRGVKPIG